MPLSALSSTWKRGTTKSSPHRAAVAVLTDAEAWRPTRPGQHGALSVRVGDVRDCYSRARGCPMAPPRGEGCMTKTELVNRVAATVQLPTQQTEAVITQCVQA